MFPLRQLYQGNAESPDLYRLAKGFFLGADVSRQANVKCTPSTPAPARKRRRPNQDLQERLARCEELLKEYAHEKPEHLEPRTSQSAVPDEPHLGWQPTGKLVRDEGSMRFMDSPLLVVYDEVRPTPDRASPSSKAAYSLDSGSSGP